MINVIKTCLRVHGTVFHRSNYIIIALLVSIAASEGLSTFIMTILATFYETIAQNNKSSFQQCIWKALVIVFCISLAKTASQVLGELVALLCRSRLVSSLHHQYSLHGSHIHRYDNVDERITQDANLFSDIFVKVVRNLVAIPFIIVFYSWTLFHLFGAVAPIICYIYFMFGFMITSPRETPATSAG